MKTGSISVWRKGIAVCLTAAMAFLLPATALQGSQAKAAEASPAGSFIKEVKLFVKPDGELKDAEEWCAAQGDDWEVLKGETGEEYNLNKGASVTLTEEIGVFLCYQKTADPDEAITDLALMNEKGGYSEGEYELLLKKQKESYINMVKNMKSMIDEYKENYKKKTPMAVRSHDFLNVYKDDDSGELLGDILLNADDDRLAEIFLQCNGMVVLAVQEKLAAACDKANTTWLDRMVKLGSFDKLKNAFSQNVQGGDAEAAMEKQYKEDASRILDNWDDLSVRIAGLNKIVDENGLSGASEKQIKAWVEALDPKDKANISYQELMIVSTLAKYKYGDKTLLNYFSKTKAQVERDGIETLYPLAACLTKGQISALSESVGLFQLLQDALATTLVNDNNTGIMSYIKNDTDGSKAISDTRESVEEIDEMIEMLGEKKVSIYEGVDRDVFKGGVAVTTDARNASAGSEKSWTNVFADKNGKLGVASIAMGVGAVCTGLMAGIFSYAAHVSKDVKISGLRLDEAFDVIKNGKSSEIDSLCNAGTQEYIKKNCSNYKDYVTDLLLGDDDAASAFDDMAEMSKSPATIKGNASLYNKLKIGMAVFTVLLAAADIALTVYALYEYYNADHLPIPHYIVDMKYSETTEASYVAYKSVPDQNGQCGDVNGGSSKQWLALYYTKDKNAGSPILAPGSSREWVYQTGDSSMPGRGYTPLHMFGEKNVSQNLTFADGDSGYSFNDSLNGIYLFFSHADTKVIYSGKSDEDLSDNGEDVPDDKLSTVVDKDSTEAVDAQDASDQTGTAVSGGVVALVGVLGLAFGGIFGFVIADTRRKKRYDA